MKLRMRILSICQLKSPTALTRFVSTVARGGERVKKDITDIYMSLYISIKNTFQMMFQIAMYENKLRQLKQDLGNLQEVNRHQEQEVHRLFIPET